MNVDNAIEVKNIGKKFRIYMDKGHTLKEKMLFSQRRSYEERTVLDGISFRVRKGEAIGLIGHNGCGKSTTLKLLSKIMYPDTGEIEMKGRVSSLIELGAGFHPDMSGRENIYINASIFGLSRKEIDNRLDDIIAFSELEQYIDNPVRTYSSGMYMRLAFSVAINVDADILLIDEILAVGDAGFQTKCFNRLKEIKANGTTIVIVSHSMGQIEQICERSIWIHQGKIMYEGNPRDVHPRYLDYMQAQRIEVAKREEVRQKEKVQQKKEKAKPQVVELLSEEVKTEKKNRWGNGNATVTDVNMLNADGNKCTTFITEDVVTIRIEYKLVRPVVDAVFGIGIFRIDGVQCYGTNTRIDQMEKYDLTKDGEVHFRISNLNLLPGNYLLDVAIESDMGTPVDYYREAIKFSIYSKMGDVGIMRMEHSWEIKCI